MPQEIFQELQKKLTPYSFINQLQVVLSYIKLNIEL